MTDFTALTTPRATAPLHFEADIPDGWQQGRGAFGGLVIANLVRALEAAEEAPERALRSLTAELCGPVLPGPAEIAIDVLRRGSGVSTLAARLTQGGEVLAHAVAVIGKPRIERTRANLPRPSTMIPWRDVPVLDIPAPFGPTFAPHYEFRNTGPFPYSGAAEPLASGWVRPRNRGPARDAAYIAGLADGWWPAFLATEPAPRPMATIAFTLEIVGTLAGLDPEAPLFHDARIVAEHEGYVVEFRHLWGEDGRLVALNQQTLAVIR